MIKQRESEFVLCLDSGGYEPSLVAWKVYRLVPDAESLRLGMIRVIDESNEDYLFPENLFLRINLPEAAKSRFPPAA